MRVRKKNKYYKLACDVGRIDKAIDEGTNTIFADDSNLNDITYKRVKKGFFCYCIVKGEFLDEWPVVEFYYKSTESSLENEYLLNVDRWPIVHKIVKEKFEVIGIDGIQYLPVKLIDVVSNKVSDNYYVMNILHCIEAYDMTKSIYTYNEKYDMYNFFAA